MSDLYAPPTKTIYDTEGYIKKLHEFRDISNDKQYRQYLLAEIALWVSIFEKECKEIAKRDDDFTYWSERALQDIEKRLNLLNLEVKIVVGKAEGISPEQIARAREYPLSELIQSKRGMAKCPFHNDKNPSMDVRKNFYHCYGCGVHGDSIDMVMKTRGLTFTQAINYLT